MINALEPDVHALENGAGEGRNPGEILRSAVRAAEQGMKATMTRGAALEDGVVGIVIVAHSGVFAGSAKELVEHLEQR